LIKTLFLLCEGSHDVQFISRVLLASGQYEMDNRKISEFDAPLNGLFLATCKNKNWEAIHFGKPQTPLLPEISMKKRDNSSHIIFYSLGGSEQYENAIQILKMIYEDLSHPGVLSVSNANAEYSVLFFFDADNLGTHGRLNEFIQRYNAFFENELVDFQIEKWKRIRGHALGLFVFAADDSDQGTLEDTLIQLFKQHKSDRLSECYKLLDQHSDHQLGTIAQQSKRAKSALTIYGQNDRINAGYSLAVILKNYQDLDRYFDFNKPEKKWSRILKMINEAFSLTI